MPPKRKGKKVVSNRGFSTTSIPAKRKEEDVVEVPVDELPPAEQPVAVQAGAPVSIEDEEWSPEAMELHELQTLGDKIRLSGDKEVSRISKGIDYERRLAKSLPAYHFTEPDLQRRILAKAFASSTEEVLQPVHEGEDKVVAKVAVLFGVLEQLGFTKERVEMSLRSVKSLELEDALDWLFLHCDESELRCEGPFIAPLPSSEPLPPTRLSAACSTVTDTMAPPSPLTSVPEQVATSTFQRPASVVPEQTITSSSPLPASTAREDPPKIDASLRARILAYEESDESEPEEEGAAKAIVEEEKDLNSKWAGLKVQLSEVQRAQNVAKRSAGRGKVVKGEKETLDAKVISLGKRMKTIEGDYLFRKIDAEKIFREERIKLDASQLAARLATTDIDPPSPFRRDNSRPRKSSGHTSTTTATSSPPEPVTTDTTASDEDVFGGLLEEMPEELNDRGTTITVREMALPKHFSGKTPRANLEETVHKVDKFATIVFKTISRSRAVRASCEIRWYGGRTQFFDMQEIACWDQAQAYNYVATVALHAVGQIAASKQLPLQFRDLWDECAVLKKAEDDVMYREELKLYKSIAEPRIQPAPSRAQTVLKLTTKEEAHFVQQPTISAVDAERIKHEIMNELVQRQSWPSYQSMAIQRERLPIAAFREHIMSTIDSAQCVVLCGETGCGKSTQVPSFILEHCMAQGKPVKIFCTEPRRISAISLAQRVSSELGEAPGSAGSRSSLVGYSIRLDSRVSPSSKIIYATTGIVLRMLEGKESLADCTHLIIDEVHERSIDSDFLLIVLRGMLHLRRDLKVILMSATVDADKISSYMGSCPVITVPGRTFPVTARYLEDVVELTGYRLDGNSDSPYVARSMRTFGGRARKLVDPEIPLDDDDSEEQDRLLTTSALQPTSLSKQTRTTLEYMDHHAINFDLIVLLLERLCFSDSELVDFSRAILIFLPSLDTIRKLAEILEGHHAFGSNGFIILPLHSTTSNENQGMVFNVPPPGVRKIVISTNLAETGVTIPDITCVIDSGKHREMRFDEKRQISRLVETWIAKSNANQRKGRAGRVQEGVCFRMYSVSRFESVMVEHPQPEMLRLSLQDLAMRIKIMEIGGIEEVLLQALDPPSVVNVQRAIASLVETKALTATEEITPLGRHLAKLPMDVHLGKFLIMSCLFNCLDAALTITAALNSKSPWLTPFGRESEADAVKRSFKIENSDFLTLYNAFGSWREACHNGYEREFVRKSFLSPQNLQMIEELRQQYFSILTELGFIPPSARTPPPPRTNKSRLRFLQIPPTLDNNSHDPKIVSAVLASAMYPKLLVLEGGMRTLANNAPAAIHPSSVNFAPGRRVDFGDAKFVTFFTAMVSKRLYVWESGTVDERAIYLLCGNGDFTLAAHTLSIDRKIRVSLESKTALAFKLLRTKFAQLFMIKMRNPGLAFSEEEQKWWNFIREAVGSKKVEMVEKGAEKERVKVSLVKLG